MTSITVCNVMISTNAKSATNQMLSSSTICSIVRNVNWKDVSSVHHSLSAFNVIANRTTCSPQQLNNVINVLWKDAFFVSMTLSVRSVVLGSKNNPMLSFFANPESTAGPTTLPSPKQITRNRNVMICM